MWLCGLRRPKRYAASHTVGLAEAASQRELQGSQPVIALEDGVSEAKHVVRIPSASTKVNARPGRSVDNAHGPGAEDRAPVRRRFSVESGRNKQLGKQEISKSTEGTSEGAGDAVLRTVLDQLCYPVTLIDSDGVVVLQNNASRQLWGDMLSGAGSKGVRSGDVASAMAGKLTGGGVSPLNVVFSSDREAYLEALHKLEEGRVWRGLLQMPSAESLQAFATPVTACSSQGPLQLLSTWAATQPEGRCPQGTTPSLRTAATAAVAKNVSLVDGLRGSCEATAGPLRSHPTSRISAVVAVPSQREPVFDIMDSDVTACPDNSTAPATSYEAVSLQNGASGAASVLSASAGVAAIAAAASSGVRGGCASVASGSDPLQPISAIQASAPCSAVSPGQCLGSPSAAGPPPQPMVSAACRSWGSLGGLVPDAVRPGAVGEGDTSADGRARQWNADAMLVNSRTEAVPPDEMYRSSIIVDWMERSIKQPPLEPAALSAVPNSCDGAASAMAMGSSRARSETLKPMALAIAPATADLGGGGGMGASPAYNSQMQHRMLLAEGLTTSALGTLVKGRSRRMPRRNMSVTNIMQPNSAQRARLLSSQLDSNQSGSSSRLPQPQQQQQPGCTVSATKGDAHSMALLTSEDGLIVSSACVISYQRGTLQSMEIPEVRPAARQQRAQSAAPGRLSGSLGLIDVSFRPAEPGASAWSEMQAAHPTSPGGGPHAVGDVTSANISRCLASSAASQAMSSGSRADSAGHLASNSARPTSPMHRLLNMAFTVAGGNQSVVGSPAGSRSSIGAAAAGAGAGAGAVPQDGPIGAPAPQSQPMQRPRSVPQGTQFGVTVSLPVQSARSAHASILMSSSSSSVAPLLLPQPTSGQTLQETAVLFRNMQAPPLRSGASYASSEAVSRATVPMSQGEDGDRPSHRSVSYTSAGTKEAAAARGGAEGWGQATIAVLGQWRTAGNELTFANNPARLSISALDALVDTHTTMDAAMNGETRRSGGGDGRTNRSHSVQLCTTQAPVDGDLGEMEAETALEAPVEMETPPHAQWHEVTLISFTHPTLERPVTMMVQNNVSARVWAERHVARVMEAEHSLLENIFPVHVLQHIAATASAAAEAEDGGVSHPENVRARLSSAGQQPGMAAALAGIQWPHQQHHPPSSTLPTVHITGSTFLHLATSHSALTVLFCDIQGFTTMCNVVKPAAVMAFLNDLYTRLDAMLDVYGVYKVETIGDCYVAAGGLMKVDEETGAVTVRSDDVDPQHANRTVQFAKALLAAANVVRLPTTGEPVRLRVGIHSGPAMSGVVGTRMPRFCLFGDTINTASRMESTGVAGAIHVSEATHDLVSHEAWEPTGGVEAKGKGVMKTFLLRPLGDK